MAFEKFEDIYSWQKAGGLSVEVYRVFNNCRDFAFKDQIQRAVVSIMNNIAEGFERQTNKEFTNFLYIARGSAGEVRSMLYLAFKLGYISQTDFNKLLGDAEEISRLIYGLIKTL
jgi:four helix bundle protein